MSGRASSIIIVGGGASGVVLAAHLLKSPNPDLRVTLVEKRPHFGQGAGTARGIGLKWGPRGLCCGAF